VPKWIRQAATVINDLLRRRGSLPALDAAPDDPAPGQGYFDRPAGMARIWDGATWRDLW
jgi:hypothetical protein